MNARTIRLMGATAVLLATSVMANPVTIQRFPGYYTLPGGEFTILGSAEVNLPLYSHLTIVNGGFQSFCLEKNEGLNNQPFWSVVSLDAKLGGVGGPRPDPLSIGAAWLYHQFATGVLFGYNYAPPGANRSASAKDLQETLWWLEDELAAMPINPFSALVVARFPNPKADYNPNDPSTAGFNNVRLLNMYVLNAAGNGPDLSKPRQDMLILVPDGGLTLILLGCGLLGLAAIRRKE